MNNKTCEGCKHMQTAWLDVQGTVKEVQCGCNKNFSRILKIDKDELDSYYKLKYNCVWKNVDEPYMKLGYIFILRSVSDLPVLEYNIGLIKDKNPTWIGINTLDPSIEKISNVLKPLNVKYSINLNIEEIDDHSKIDQFMNNINDGWTLVNEVKSYFNHRAYETLIDIHFYNPKPALLIKDDLETINYKVNNVCFNNLAYRKLGGSMEYRDWNKDIIFRKTFAQKLEEQPEKMIFTWNEI